MAVTDPGFAALLFDKLQVPEYPQKGRHEGDNCCEVCATHLNQLRQEALQMVQALAQTGRKETPDFAPSTFSGIPQRTGLHNMVTLSSSKDWALQASRQTSKPTNTLPGADRRKGLGWPQGVSNIPKSSVQVTVGPGALSSTLSSVTIQAQQYLEGMWSISRVNNFLPQACLARHITNDRLSDASSSTLT
ncbi:UNVERIFIED_CONTAM: hypothetical protein FKN15_028350 [Acipenser sinensis]